MTEILRRKAYQLLLEWKKTRAAETALLIEGARRVGKSTLAEHFAANEYRSYVLIDFWRVSDEVREAFFLYMDDLDTFFRYLQLYYNVELFPGESLIIFDEVQLFPRARSCIKQLVADGRFHYLETGSLISIRQNVSDEPIPSEETAIRLNPLDFEEFLWALDKTILAEGIREARDGLAPLPEGIHRNAMRLFREYLLVGGMPQAVLKYREAGSFQEVDRVKRDILALYRNDITRFAKGYASKIHAAFDAIPGELSRHEKKYRLSSISENARTREYGEAFDWMADACIVDLCKKVADPQVGLRLYEEGGSFKCYMADTGLLVTEALADRTTTDERIYQDVVSGKIDINEGMLTENAVAQQLVAQGDCLRFYSESSRTSPEDRMEIDFLVARPFDNAGGKVRISPIEVKSGKRYGLSSLDKFKKKFDKRVGTQFVLHPKPLEVAGERLFLPLYMSHLI